MLLFRKISADIVFVFHIIIVLILLFGWMFEEFNTVYFLTLLATLLSWILFKGCVLTQIEFYIRKELHGKEVTYDESFINFYGYKILGDKVPSKKIIEPLVWIFLIISICTYIYSNYMF